MTALRVATTNAKGGATKMTIAATTRVARANRWSQLWLGVLAMVLIANLQYGWTLFVDPIHVARGWSLTEIQFAFSIFIATETLLTPIEGWIVDRLGARKGPPIMIAFGGALVAISWVITSAPPKAIMIGGPLRAP